MKNKISILISLVVIYFLLKYYIPFGNYIIYPINLLVTFMHEFGHAFGALITGGRVNSIEINSDGSGFARTIGGFRSVVLMGGYIGSAIFGNLLLYISFKKKKYSELTIYILSGLMIFTAIFWFNSIFSSIILFLVSLGLFLMAKYSKFDSYVLQFLGVASILFIIEDFNIGPSSDLSKFADLFLVIPQFVWMYIWLFLVIGITYYNLKKLIKIF